MGTRNLTCVVIDGQFKVAQYCQWDGYPGGQGKTVYGFCKDMMSNKTLDDFKSKVRSLRALTDEEVHAKWKECGADDSGWVNMEVSSAMSQRYPHLQRNMGAGVLSAIASGDVKEVHLDTGFASDSLFCEFAYVIDLDNDVLEVYKGFQKAPHNSGRFADRVKTEAHRSQHYYPVALAIQFKLDDLPGDDNAFIEAANKACGMGEEEEDE